MPPPNTESSAPSSSHFVQQHGPPLVTLPLNHHRAAPVGLIVGGAVGGTVFLAGVAALVCLLATGRLKGCKCCSSSTSAAVPAPASGGSAPAAVTGFRGSAASSSATAAAPAAPAGFPPAPSGGVVGDPMLTVREIPVAGVTPPPPYGESNPPCKE